MAASAARYLEPVAALPRRIPRPLKRFLLVSPALVWIVCLILLPNAFLISYSLWKNELGTILHVWNVHNYTELFSSQVFITLLKRTLLIAVVSTTCATLIAYPLAYVVVTRFGRYKTLAALLIIVPLWVSYLMRVFAWKIILGENGVLNGLLKSIGLIEKPSTALLYSTTTVIVTLTYVAIPYVFLASYTSLDRVPKHYYEASSDCGASAWRTFRHVVWPLTRPGVAVGFAIGFVLTFGDYVTPQMVGGLSGTMLGSIVLQSFGTADNWPQGAAIGVTIICTGLIVLALLSLFTRLEAEIE
ncbi:MAG TPA: ABC transporter permease [Solirubrobacteraceae bacterium]